MSTLGTIGPLVIVGAGPAGSLLALYLAQQGHKVDVYESRADLRTNTFDGGRSINLALATRGIVALHAAGIGEEVAGITIPMVGRMVHTDGEPSLQRYGLEDHEVIHSVNRRDLNAILLNAAAATGRVRFYFEHRLREVDLDNHSLRFSIGEDTIDRPFGLVMGADGANSLVRTATIAANGGTVSEEPLDHGYKELTVAVGQDGDFQLNPNALHIWPRGDFMLIALANPQKDFTATLFLPNHAGIAAPGGSFAELDSPAAIERFFNSEFPTFAALVPDLVEQFTANPTGSLSTIRCSPWSYEDRSVILGDAAHAIVPFHGQGMNAAMESAAELMRQLEVEPHDLAGALATFSAERKPDVDAIADMALDNYVEMRAGVVDPSYLLKRELALELQRRHPDRYAARYGMVMFSTIPYAAVVTRAEAQAQILNVLTAGVTSVENVDFERAASLVAQLDPLPAIPTKGSIS